MRCCLRTPDFELFSKATCQSHDVISRSKGQTNGESGTYIWRCRKFGIEVPKNFISPNWRWDNSRFIAYAFLLPVHVPIGFWGPRKFIILHLINMDWKWVELKVQKNVLLSKFLAANNFNTQQACRLTENPRKLCKIWWFCSISSAFKIVLCDPPKQGFVAKI